MLLVDTNVLLDVLENALPWAGWSAVQLRQQSQVHELAISPVVYAELAPSFDTPSQLDQRLDDMQLSVPEFSRPALFLAGCVHRRYRRAGGAKQSVLADFLIGAQAMVLGCGILTRDARRYRNYFPGVPLITP